MKKATIALLALILTVSLTSVAEARQRHRRTTTIVQASDDRAIVGVKLDMPKLLGLKQLSPNLFLGLEGGKNVMRNPFRNASRSYFQDDKGFFGDVKVSYFGCLGNCPGK